MTTLRYELRILVGICVAASAFAVSWISLTLSVPRSARATRSYFWSRNPVTSSMRASTVWVGATLPFRSSRWMRFMPE